MRRMFSVIAIALLALTLVAGCGESMRVKRVATDKTTDLSGRWNDTDARLVSGEIVGDCMAQGWYGEWQKKHADQKPVVIVGQILNKSDEHINVDVFVKEIQRALINSQKVRFVANSNERTEIRKERVDQHDGNTSDETRASVGQEVGANYMMKGSVNTVVDEIGGHKAVFYQVNVELHDLTTNEIVWVGQKEIKKIINKSSVKW